MGRLLKLKYKTIANDDKELVGDKQYIYKKVSYMVKGVQEEYLFIIQKDSFTNEVKDTIYSDYFFGGRLINCSINTKANEARTIKLFLNFIFFSPVNENKLRDIEDLTIEDGTRFLNTYKGGMIGGRRRKGGQTVKNATQTLLKFYRFLILHHKLKMKFLVISQFQYETVKRKINNIDKEIKTITNVFAVAYGPETRRKKAKGITVYCILLLIQLAEQYDQMLALAIAFQAFAGLRRGEVCQMAFQRNSYIEIINGEYIEKAITENESINMDDRDTMLFFNIDLTYEERLRDDGIVTGNIKRKREQVIYPAFLPYFSKLYHQHLYYLNEQSYLDDRFNKHGAMFLSRDGLAITKEAYNTRFDNLVTKLLNRLSKLDDLGDKEATSEIGILQTYKLTPHSLRYFFTRYVARYESHIDIIAAYRGDTNLLSAYTYLKDNTDTQQHIEDLQNSFMENIREIKGRAIRGEINGK